MATLAWYGRFGVSRSGAMRTLVMGPAMCVCDRCGKSTERHRVFAANDYRDYFPGDYCWDDAVIIAMELNAKDERDRHAAATNRLRQIGL